MRLDRTESYTQLDSADEPVVLLYSLRFAPPPQKKEQKNYHLLYLLSGRISRTLDRAELLEDLEQSVWAMGALEAKEHVLLQGFYRLDGDGRSCALTLKPLKE